jgi:Na+-translocating ferredoxin:NAD+ oxidoreductase subunit B
MSAEMWIATAVIGGTGVGCAVILAVAARVFAVHEDARIAQIAAILPGINCGGCGYAGCPDYAKHLIVPGADLALCKPGGADTVARLAQFLGVEAKAAERKVAIVLCAGGDRVAAREAEYNGLADCVAADLAGGAGKACRYGCLGFGSCSRVCPVAAIEIRPDRLAVIHPDLCISCGKCVNTCPRKLIKLVPESRFIHILCSSRERGPVTKKQCSVGCIACTLCVKLTDGVGIRMESNLAVVDYGIHVENEAVIAKCPQHTIVNRSGHRREVRSEAAPAA